MDKKKLMILGTSIISLFVIIGLSIFLLLGTKEEKNPKEEEEKTDLALNEDLNIDEELLFEYNKDSMLGTSSPEVKELEKDLENKEDNTKGTDNNVENYLYRVHTQFTYNFR